MCTRKVDKEIFYKRDDVLIPLRWSKSWPTCGAYERTHMALDSPKCCAKNHLIKRQKTKEDKE